MSGTAKSKVAVVAGAGGGIGLAVANMLIAEGASVVLADVKDMPDGITDGPGSYVYKQGDLSDESFVADVFESATTMFGRLDYLVNTLGVLWFDRDKSVVTMDMDVWDTVFKINLKSFALTSRYAVPAMKKSGGGAMVHFSSIDATGGDPKPQDAYAISKAAVIRLSKGLAVQFAADGIRSNSILPGPTMSPMQSRWEGKDDVQQKIGAMIPLGRLGHVDDLANAAMFLLSDKAAWITGTELVVDGGITAGV